MFVRRYGGIRVLFRSDQDLCGDDRLIATVRSGDDAFVGPSELQTDFAKVCYCGASDFGADLSGFVNAAGYVASLGRTAVTFSAI